MTKTDLCSMVIKETSEENLITTFNIINIDCSWTRCIGFSCKISIGSAPRLGPINPKLKWESDFPPSCCDLKQELTPRILPSTHERSTINGISSETVIGLSEQLSCSSLCLYILQTSRWWQLTSYKWVTAGPRLTPVLQTSLSHRCSSTMIGH